VKGGGGPTGKPRAAGRVCPICGKPASEEAYPFCSKRCANVDLNRWLSGGYVIPARSGDDEERAEDGEAEG